MSANTAAKPTAPMSGSSPSSSAAAAAAAPHPHHAHVTAPPPSSPASAPRDYRKGNWTLHETLVLIAAKRLDDDCRGTPTPRSAEQRWKWVEDYCWGQGCLRSQNQCNDKWDNLLRDYKKVRDYEASAHPSPAAGSAAQHRSYWSVERHERKGRNLPTNLAPEVFDALRDVLARRAARRGGGAPPPPIAPPPKPPLLAHNSRPPPHLPLPPATTSASGEDVSGPSESGNDDEEPETKRRRLNRLGSSVVRGATVLARAMVACEEKRERRHRELLGLEERRLRLEEERTEVWRQGFAGLVSAVSGLSTAIHALVSTDHHHDSSSRR